MVELNEKYLLLGNLIIDIYGIVSFVGIIIALICVIKIGKRNLNILDLLILFGIILLSFIFGAKVTNIIENNLNKLTIQAGYTYTGGVAFGIMITYIYAKIFKYDFYKILSSIIIIFPIIYAFSKVGCFIKGCCTGNLAVPIQLIESFIGIALSVFIYIGLKKCKNTNNIIFMYLILYGIIRFILDFHRNMRNTIVFNITITQIICIIFLIIGLIKIEKKRIEKWKIRKKTILKVEQ